MIVTRRWIKIALRLTDRDARLRDCCSRAGARWSRASDRQPTVHEFYPMDSGGQATMTDRCSRVDKNRAFGPNGGAMRRRQWGEVWRRGRRCAGVTMRSGVPTSAAGLRDAAVRATQPARASGSAAVRPARSARDSRSPAVRAWQVAVPDVDWALCVPDGPQRRPEAAFFVCRRAFPGRKNALSGQQSSMRDFHFPLNDATPGRECGAVTREQSGNDA